MNQKETIEFVIDEFKPMKEDNLVIIFAFASSGLIFFLAIFISIFISPDTQYFTLALTLAMISFVVGMIMLSLKIFRVLRKLGVFGGYERLNDF